MDRMNRLLAGLSVREDQLSSTKCILDYGAQLLIISGWSQYLTRGVTIALTIADETDQLEWTCLIETVLYTRLTVQSFHVKIPSASQNHRFVVTTKVLHRIPDSDGETAGAECYKVTSESSCAAKMSLDGVAGVERTTTFPVFDVRPHLRSDVGIGSGDVMHSILTAGTSLPTTKSKSFVCSGDSVQLQIYQGDSDQVSHNKRVHSVKLEFQSKKPEKTVEVALDVTVDGTLTTAANERIYSNAVATQAPRIIDVICPKISIDTRDPELQVEWTQKPYRRNKAFLDISTTYAEVHQWRLTVDEAGVAKGNGGGGGHLLFFARVDFSQRIEIPSDVVETGIRYNITVEGLQLIDDRVVGSTKNFRIICRKSAALKPIALPARTTTASALVRSARSDNSASSVEPIRRLPPQRSPAVQVDLDLRIQIERSTFHQASVVISTNPHADLAVRKWKITVMKISMGAGILYVCSTKEFVADSKRFDFPLQFEAGRRYRVTVAPLEWSDGVVRNPDTSVEKTAEFRAELTLDDLRALYSVAKQHASYYGSSPTSPCYWLYRNKSAEYFQKINHVRGGIMEVYHKDNSGDPASPINLQIKGLFFMASVEQGTSGEPKRNSPFGPLRICIPAEELLGVAPNVYFVDFYCMRGQNHQVTLVMTRPGSVTDIHCAQRLLLLDLDDRVNNPFFFYDASRQLRVSTREHLLVELLYTEDINITRYPLKHVPTVGRGSSTPGGLPKNANCGLCNLHGRSGFPKF